MEPFLRGEIKLLPSLLEAYLLTRQINSQENGGKIEIVARPVFQFDRRHRSDHLSPAQAIGVALPLVAPSADTVATE